MIVCLFQLEEDPFNPDYVEVDRVLDVAEHTDPNTGKTIKHYLVKWRSLQYEDSTWELEEDIDPSKIEQFILWNKIPPRDQWLSLIHIYITLFSFIDKQMVTLCVITKQFQFIRYTIIIIHQVYVKYLC